MFHFVIKFVRVFKEGRLMRSEKKGKWRGEKQYFVLFSCFGNNGWAEAVSADTNWFKFL